MAIINRTENELCHIYVGNDPIANINGWVDGRIISEENGLYTVRTRTKKYEGIQSDNIIKKSDIKPLEMTTESLYYKDVFEYKGEVYTVEQTVNKTTGKSDYKVTPDTDKKIIIIEASKCVGWYDQSMPGGAVIV